MRISYRENSTLICIPLQTHQDQSNRNKHGHIYAMYKSTVMPSQSECHRLNIVQFITITVQV